MFIKGIRDVRGDKLLYSEALRYPLRLTVPFPLNIVTEHRALVIRCMALIHRCRLMTSFKIRMGVIMLLQRVLGDTRELYAIV